MADTTVTATHHVSIPYSTATVHLDFYAHTTRDSRQHWEVSALLPPDARDGAIVVGGGGAALAPRTGKAFLTASCPTKDLDGWVVASKNQADVTDAHQLEVYFVALRIEGMRRPDLVRLVQIFEASSVPAERPTAEVVVPASHAILSGGFRVDWHGAGNFATASCPSAAGNNWIAKSTSHIKSDSAAIHAYAIGIKKILPGALSVEQHIERATNIQVPLDPEFLLTGAGAEVNWTGLGSMLVLIGPFISAARGQNPVSQKVEAQARDHSTITVYAVGAKLDNIFDADHLARYVQGLTGAGV